ncbi:hypothetical protein ABT093_07270 [Kitasatospora sp. NPDC002551]|uniref:hypothetical protein n=1 Tax=unclassified Kitasatospora TaxID=2633591 RepID=UPI0033188EC6
MFEQAEDADATLGAAEEGVHALDFLISIDDTERSSTVGEKGLFGRRDGAAGEASVRSIPVVVLRENLQRTVDGLQAVLGEIRVPEGGMPLKQAQARPQRIRIGTKTELDDFVLFEKKSPADAASRLEALGFTLSTEVTYTRPDGGARESGPSDGSSWPGQVL